DVLQCEAKYLGDKISDDEALALMKEVCVGMGNIPSIQPLPHETRVNGQNFIDLYSFKKPDYGYQNPSGEPGPQPGKLAWLDMSRWDTDPVPERQWAIKDRVPLNQAGLFSGEGGTGKSIIELMKNVAHVSGKDWLGSLPEIGPAFYVGA